MKKSKYIIVEERISTGYYVYRLYLLDTQNKCMIDYEYYGDESYWGVPNSEITFDEALEKLLINNGISKDEIQLVSCGGYYQDGCEEEIIDMIYKSCYEV